MGRRSLGHAALPIALLAALAMANAGLISPDKKMTGMWVGGNKAETEELWWHHAVIYQIYPRSFADSNGDGIGDLKGITSKLPYLKDLGVGAVWLSPIYPSPQKDFGYDIKDFKNVDPTYGTLADFKELVDTTHALGMKVVLDLVPNHSSDEHPWFEKSINKEEPYTDYYVWKQGKFNETSGKYDIPPNNWMSHFRFSAWEWNKKRQEFYLHQFAIGQPDLNYGNANLVQEIKDVFRFWMGQGADGFRVDALPFLFENNYEKDEPLNPNPSDGLDMYDNDWYLHPYTMDDDRTYDMLHQWRDVIDKYEDGKPRVMMTECYTSFDKTIEYYGTQDKLGAHFTFNFQLISYTTASSNATVFKTVIDQWMNAMDWQWPNWVIGNHDNKRVATRFPNMADAMNMISMTLPGTAMTYNGEELGMTDGFITWEQTKDPQAINAGPEKYSKTSRDGCRTPMQWNDSKNAGFSTNDTTWMPTNPNYWEINVEKEQSMRRSHLSVYKDLIAARKTETMKKGKWVTEVLNDDVLAISRLLDGHETYITVVNLGSWVKKIKTSDFNIPNLKVYSAGVNSELSKGEKPAEITLRPKEGIILTSGDVTPDSHTTPSPNIGSRTTSNFVLFSLLMPLLGLRL